MSYYMNGQSNYDWGGWADGSGGSGASVPVMPMPSQVMPLPEYKSPAAYKAPEYDENRVNEIAQTGAAGTVRGLRSALQKVIGSRYENPNVKRMTLRDALAGYGQGMQSAMSEAANQARTQYNTEYGIKADEGKTNYGTAVNAANMKYQAANQAALTEYSTAWNSYLALQNMALKEGSSKETNTAKLPPNGLTPEQYAAWHNRHQTRNGVV